jgi:hypothetical protein
MESRLVLSRKHRDCNRQLAQQPVCLSIIQRRSLCRCHFNDQFRCHASGNARVVTMYSRLRYQIFFEGLQRRPHKRPAALSPFPVEDEMIGCARIATTEMIRQCRVRSVASFTSALRLRKPPCLRNKQITREHLLNQHLFAEAGRQCLVAIQHIVLLHEMIMLRIDDVVPCQKVTISDYSQNPISREKHTY